MLKFMSGLIALPVIGGVFTLILNVVLAGLLVLTYTSLTQEELVVNITFTKETQQPKVYKAQLYSANGSKINDYIIYGDQWRIDAGFIKMKYMANVLGIDSKYTLNRFEGRYKSINDQNTKKHQAYQIESHGLIDSLDFFFDTTYGSSVYENIKLDTKYSVYKTQTGLMVRKKYLKEVKEKSMMDKTKELFSF